MKKLAKVKENSPALWCIPPLRPKDSKYTRGHIVILGGEAMTGAAKLSALAAQRAGAGMVSIAASKAAWPVYARSMKSVIARECTTRTFALLIRDVRVSAVLIGPGAGLNARARCALRAAASAGKPLVLDADALTLMAQDAALRKLLQPCAKILTPHEGEYTRLAKALGIRLSNDKAALAEALARALNAVVVLKGHETIVSDGSGATRKRPPAWLATAGTGDVLAGIIAALVGQGMVPLDAANAGVWLHAKAAMQHGKGMIAEDLIASLPEVLRRLK